MKMSKILNIYEAQNKIVEKYSEEPGIELIAIKLSPLAIEIVYVSNTFNETLKEEMLKTIENAFPIVFTKVDSPFKAL